MHSFGVVAQRDSRRAALAVVKHPSRSLGGGFQINQPPPVPPVSETIRIKQCI